MSDQRKNNDKANKPMSSEIGFYYQAIGIKWLMLAIATGAGVLGLIVLLILFTYRRKRKS